MLPAEIKEIIGRLDPGSLTSFVGSLLGAEIARLGIPPENLVISDQINENDGGLDGLVQDVPRTEPGSSSALPVGLVGLQIKATRRKNPAAFELSTELRKPGPKRVLLAGGTYVLVSSQDLNYAQRKALEDEVLAEASLVMQENMAGDRAPCVAVWDAQTLSGLTSLHPAAAIDIGLDDFEQALSLSELLESLRAADRPFQTDQARDDAIQRLRERARQASSDPLLLMLHGDAGAGKTRAVAHALDIDELRDLVVYANGVEGLRLLTTRMIRNRSSRGILFVDEVDDSDIFAASNALGGIGGRWRIVSVRTRSDHTFLAQGGRNIVLPPLDADATRRLIENSGLPEPLARMVAEVAEGFPQLAFRLADELVADPGLDLVRLAHLPSSADVLQRALPDEEVRKHLAVIALFNAVGFEEELFYEAQAVAAAFDLDIDRLQLVCDDELARGFVSRAGRYRMVSPRLVAIWLASDLIAKTPRFEDRLLGLPESLTEAFVRQLGYFGPGSPHLPDALRRVIAADRFTRPGLFTEAAGRLLRASAAIVPEQVAETIGALLASASEDDLTGMPRRDLVWTLQVLLWWPETWDAATASLYRLAQHETETWANNATASFAAAFAVFLSGSVVPYAHRAEWLRRAIDEALPQQLALLGAAAAAGLQIHHVRTVVGFQGGGEPRDWQPPTAQEYLEARQTAWHLLLAVRDRAQDETRPEFTKPVAQSLRVAYGELGSAVEREIRSRTWSTEERVELASGIRDVLHFEELDGETREAVAALHDYLIGHEQTERLLIILRTSLWDLHTDSASIHDVPPLLIQMADELAEAGQSGLTIALEAGRELEQQDTRFALFRLLSLRLGPDVVGAAAVGRKDWPALSGALAVADESNRGSWATATLRELAEPDPERVPELLTYVELLPERLDLALSLVDEGRASGAALSRLLYGARIRSIDEGHAVRLLRTVQSSGNIEASLGMLDQWVEQHPEPSQAVSTLAGDLALESLSADHSHMVEFHLAKLVRANKIEPAILFPMLEARVMNRAGRVDELDGALMDRVLAQGEGVIHSILDLVRRQGSAGYFSGGDLAILSQLAAATSVDRVWDALSSWSELDLRWAIHHMIWKGLEPDPLVRAFLISNRLAGLEDEAAVCFGNTLGVVMGPFHLAVAGEVERARSWQAALFGTTGRSWAEKLVAQREIEVEWHRRRDSEDDVRLG
jgi:hypothetical protein